MENNVTRQRGNRQLLISQKKILMLALAGGNVGGCAPCGSLGSRFRQLHYGIGLRYPRVGVS